MCIYVVHIHEIQLYMTYYIEAYVTSITKTNPNHTTWKDTLTNSNTKCLFYNH